MSVCEHWTHGVTNRGAESCPYCEIDRLNLELQKRDKCAYMGPMRDCPTHGESAELVAAKAAICDAVKIEREACATECERMVMYPGGRQESAAHHDVWAAARAIRMRSKE